MHGGGVGVREADGPAPTGMPDGARQVARTPEMPDDAVPLIVDLIGARSPGARDARSRMNRRAALTARRASLSPFMHLG